LLGEALCIVSPKPQTTRHRILGVLTEKNYQLVFSDTPGMMEPAYKLQEAMMESVRGAVGDADVILLVTDVYGEALAHARQAGCPIVVALTKTDKPGADLGRCRVQLLEEGLGTEEAGGNVQVVPVSALTGDGLVQLAEALLLEADMLDLEPQPLGPQDAAAEGEGVVLEARLDRGLGPVATALLRRGWLAPGAAVVAGCQWGRVRVLRDAAGRLIAVFDVDSDQPAAFTHVDQAGLEAILSMVFAAD
jgi:translation initiation factor IF-2